jgi:Holliday junction resolvase RusA-like endonuclease
VGALTVWLVLPGQCPSGKNAVQITRTGHRYPTKRFTTWREASLSAIKEQVEQVKANVGHPMERHLHGPPYSLHVSYWPGDLRRRDVPGMLDAVFHVLERARLVEDDAHITHVQWTTEAVDRTTPRVELRLVSIRGEE